MSTNNKRVAYASNARENVGNRYGDGTPSSSNTVRPRAHVRPGLFQVSVPSPENAMIIPPPSSMVGPREQVVVATPVEHKPPMGNNLPMGESPLFDRTEYDSAVEAVSARVPSLNVMGKSGSADINFTSHHAFLWSSTHFLQVIPRLGFDYNLTIARAPYHLYGTCPVAQREVIALVYNKKACEELTDREVATCHGWLELYDTPEVWDIALKLEPVNALLLEIHQTAVAALREIKKKVDAEEAEAKAAAKIAAKRAAEEAAAAVKCSQRPKKSLSFNRLSGYAIAGADNWLGGLNWKFWQGPKVKQDKGKARAEEPVELQEVKVIKGEPEPLDDEEEKKPIKYFEPRPPAWQVVGNVTWLERHLNRDERVIEERKREEREYAWTQVDDTIPEEPEPQPAFWDSFWGNTPKTKPPTGGNAKDDNAKGENTKNHTSNAGKGKNVKFKPMGPMRVGQAPLDRRLVGMVDWEVKFIPGNFNGLEKYVQHLPNPPPEESTLVKFDPNSKL